MSERFAKLVLDGIKSIEPAPFPQVYHCEVGRFTRLLLSGEMALAEEIGRGLTVLWGRKSGKLVGLEIPWAVMPETDEPRKFPEDRPGDFAARQGLRAAFRFAERVCRDAERE